MARTGLGYGQDTLRHTRIEPGYLRTGPGYLRLYKKQLKTDPG